MSTNDPLKVAIVGCGRIADGHMEQIRRLPELARVVAACDREPLMAEQLATRYRIEKVFEDFEEMLSRARPDVVHITTPPASHVALASRAIEAGCHVYVEKPLAPRHEEVVLLLERARRAGVELTVGYTYLFDPPALVMRELCERGAIGDPVHVESIYGYDLSGPFGRAMMADRMHWVHKLPGKLLHNTIDHMLNKVVEFVDSDEPDVLALARPLADASLLDELRVILGGRRVTAYASFSAHARPIVHQARVHGTRNTMLVDYVARTVTLAHAPQLPSAIGRLLAPLPAAGDLVREVARNAVRFARSDYHFFAGLHELMRRFYVSIHSGGPPPISARHILWVSSVMARIFDQVGPHMRLYPTERVA